MKTGRPTIFTEELANKILERIRDGESVRSISRDDEMPHQSTIFDWALHHPTFSMQYDQARDVGMEARAEEIEEIASDPEIEVARAKLITDVKRWNMSKLKPKRFGDKMDVTSDGKQLPTPIIPLNVQRDDSNQTDNGAL